MNVKIKAFISDTIIRVSILKYLNYIMMYFFQIIFVCSVAMTVFLRTNMHKKTEEDGQLYLGALYYTVITVMFNGLSEIALSTMRLPVFYKQRELLFFPVWAYSIPTWILKTPVTLWEVVFWVCLTYYAIGYEQDLER